MKRLAILALLGVMAAGAGCNSCSNTCNNTRDRLFGSRRSQQGGQGEVCDQGQGQAAPTVAYPYYTTRGPRDFFACDPGYPRN